MPTHLFVYGTLQLDEILHRVTGARFRGIPAVLDGYRCYRVAGECYPGLVPEAGARTPGVLQLDIDFASLRRLDAFEGSLYRRIRVEIAAEDRPIPADTYLFHEEHRERLSDEGWDLESFRRESLQRFLGSYAGFGNPPEPGGTSS